MWHEFKISLSTLFQSTPPRRRRLLRGILFRLLTLFQSTPPRRRRRFRLQGWTDDYFISIHASAKEATGVGYVVPPGRQISIHASAKEATCRAIGGLYYQYFNPRLREGGDTRLAQIFFIVFISIHASAKEATEASICFTDCLTISIHASAKEATSTSPFSILAIDISIHASAKEATQDGCTGNRNVFISIHASAKEAT